MANQHHSKATETHSALSLSALLKGRVIVPGDADYDAARTVFHGGVDRRPSIIVRVANASDVARVVLLAQERGLELAVRGGGHSGAGHSSVEGGVVLDLRDMKDLDIDVKGCAAWAEAGLTAGEYTEATDAHGLATGFGDTGSVGIGGITLGGGIGYLVRKYGLTIDSLLAAEVVTADGQLLQTDEEHHPDLFWAIRGGGGNFGVVTRFKFRLHRVDSVVGGMLLLPATPEVIADFIAEAESAPEELSTIVNIMPAPPLPFLPAEHQGKLVMMALMAYVGEVEAGNRALEPFRKLAPPIADLIRPMRYPEMFPPEEEGYHPMAVSRTMFLDTVDRGVAENILAHLRSSTAAMRVAQLRVLGGAMARVPTEATAFAHRDSRIMVGLAAFYGLHDQAEQETWVTDFAAALRQGNDGAYVNFLGDEGAERVRAAYPGPTWERLVALKRRYDPGNLFRLNHNIPPTNPL